MARQKQVEPQKRLPTELTDTLNANPENEEILYIPKPRANRTDAGPAETTLLQLIVCVSGIYASFLSWGVLQEALTTTTYTTPESPLHPNPPAERFTFSVFLNTVQSTFAALTGFLYLYFSSPKDSPVPSPFPNKAILFPLVLVAISSSLASPFGYASLTHIDYLTFILAKSCKLLPVMLLHLTIFRKRYPLYKYAVIGLVTLGVATFTLHHPTSSKKKAAAAGEGSSTWGLFLLSINLLLDGLTNTTQDHIFSSPHLYTKFTGPQMMVAVNLLSTAFTSAYLLLTPYLSPHVLSLFPLSCVETAPSKANTNELSSALSFLARHPAAAKNVFAFSACGAIGQLFIFYTLAHFSSLLLVTVTVTRKMLTMVLSVMWFGHRLGRGQWVGVGLVFGGIGAEAVMQRREKARKLREKEKEEGKKL